MPPLYTSRAAFEAYVEGWVTDDPVALDRLLMRAERDVDALLGAWQPREDTGLKLAPDELLPWEADALSRTVCAQAEHRFVTTEGALRGETQTAALRRIKGPDFEKEYATSVAAPKAPARYGPKVRQEITPIAHLRMLGARARA